MGIIERMDYKIRSVSFRAEDGEAHIYFSGRDSDRVVTLEGYIPVDLEEFEGNSSMSAMEELVKEKLIGRQTDQEDK